MVGRQARRSSPEMGSSFRCSSATGSPQAGYNYLPFFFFIPGGGRSIGWRALAAATAALPPYMCGSRTPSCLLLSRTPFEPLLWSWQDRQQRARLVCSEAHWPVNLDTTPLSNLVFDFSWNYPRSSPPATSFPSPPLNLSVFISSQAYY